MSPPPADSASGPAADAASREIARALPRTAAALAWGQGRLHRGAQLYVSRHGTVVADGAVGEARPGVALTGDHLTLWMSSCKPLTALLALLLWQEGRLDLDDRVAAHVPEFAAGGKEAITLRHLLTHTGGFRMLSIGWPGSSWEEIVAEVCARRREPRWRPGERAGYHQAGSWFILAEVARRLTGTPYAELIRERVLEPLGMGDSWIGMPPERYRSYRDQGRLATTWQAGDGGELEVRGAESEERCVRPSPAGSGRGPIRQLARLYELLLGKGEIDGRRLLTPQTVEAMTARHRAGMEDRTFRTVIDFGLGLIVNSRHYNASPDSASPDNASPDNASPDNANRGGARPPYGYGPHAGRRSYGHSGYRSSTAFADPDHGLVVALAFNGLPAADADHEERIERVLGTLYEELGLVSGEE